MDILLRGATVLTQNAKREVLRDADVLIEENRIAAVGRGLKEKAEKVIDGKHKLLMPGLINTHTHAAMSLFRGQFDDVLLHEWLSDVQGEEARLKKGHVRAGARLAILEMVRGGTTCFADFYFFPEEVARAAEELGMRACVGSDVQDGRTPHAQDAREALALSEEFIRRFRGRPLVKPVAYAHAPYTCSEETMLKVKGLAEKYDVGMHTHLSETRREVFAMKRKTGMRPVERMEKIGVLCGRLTAAHCAWITKSEVSALARAGASVAHCPVSNMKLASGGAAPVPEMVAAGVNVALGTDGPASNNSLNMLETMKVCALLHKNARWDAAVAPAQQVLDFATRNGAGALGIDAGSVAEGKLADLVLLDLGAANLAPATGNLASAIVYAANPANVSSVIINGELVLEEGKFVKLDEEKIIREAGKAAEGLRA